jgi:hypothetical protein
MEMPISLWRSLRSWDTVSSTPRRAPDWSPALEPLHAPLVAPCHRLRREPRLEVARLLRTFQVYPADHLSRQTFL